MTGDCQQLLPQRPELVEEEDEVELEDTAQDLDCVIEIFL